MVECLNSRKIIEWQYPGEELNRIIGADRYTVEQEPAQCPVPYRLTTRWRSDRNPEWRYFERGSTDFQPPFTDMVLGKNNGSQDLQYPGFPRTIAYRPSSNTSRAWHSELRFSCRNRNGSPRSFRIPAGLRDVGGQNEYIEFVGFERLDGLPDDCGEYTFSLYKDDAVVLKKLSSEYPEVIEYCEDACPPNTCKCDCGNTVCCYDNNTGAVVKQFQKTF